MISMPDKGVLIEEIEQFLAEEISSDEVGFLGSELCPDIEAVQ